MSNLIRIIPDDAYANRITLSSQAIGRERKITYIRFGHKCCEATVHCSSELQRHELLLSANIIEQLQLPLQPRYQLKITDYEITVGPYIGLLAFRKKLHLDNSVSVLSNYLYDYESIGGAILAFSAEGVDMEKQVIEGYVYNPDLQQWDHGFYPYPKSLFKRAGMNKSLRDHFHSILGENIFNSYIFNKWEMHSWLQEFETSKPFLPDTILYETADDVLWFLKTYKEAYIKPIYGSQGAGIIKAEKIGNNFVFAYKEANVMQKKIIETSKEAKAFIKEKLKKKGYIIQQSLTLLKHGDSVIDFRMLLVKDQHGNWKDYSLITRYGKSGNYVSNISDGGKAELAVNTLRNELELSEEEVYTIRKQIARVCIDAARNIEKCGVHVGNLGIDIALDENLAIWIIEINNKDPNHTISIDAKDKQTFYQIKKANMQYAKFLAGFGDEKR